MSSLLIRALMTFLTRWLLAAILVFGAYNPSGYSCYHWIRQADAITSLHVFAAVLLVCGIVTLSRIAFLSLGYFGMTATVIATIMALTVGAGLRLFELADVRITAYTLLFWATLVLSVGTWWPFVQRRISGERDVLRSPP